MDQLALSVMRRLVDPPRGLGPGTLWTLGYRDPDAVGVGTTQ